MDQAPAVTAAAALAGLWQLGGLSPDALPLAQLSGSNPVLPSSFAVGTAAQSSIAAAALAACELAHVRGAPRRAVQVAMEHAALECVGWFSLDGKTPEVWDKFAGLYPCADGFLRIHTNFAHHRDGVLALLGLQAATAERSDVQAALQRWQAVEFETAAAQAGLVATALRSFEQWDASPQGQAVASQPLLRIERIGDAPARALPALAPRARPLQGLRVLDLTRILAGPVGTRALASYGADVLLVNAPHLPNIDAIADTSRGKLSTHLDLRAPADKASMQALLQDAHVWVQGYRPGAMQALGFGPQAVAAARPGIVYVSLSAYGTLGPWSGRRGFDSLVQTAMGFNLAEGQAKGDGQPRPLPMQLLDHASGYLIAFGAACALARQQQEGGSWHVQVSLARTGQWLRSLGRVPGGLDCVAASRQPYLETQPSGFGSLRAIRHSAVLEDTEPATSRPSKPPGSHPPRWP